jgi:aryl-alcohol dehydrogenase-like predicted oxidoreductase
MIMNRRPLGRSELVIEPLVFGGNVFGWTVDETSAFDILDAYIGEGFSAIDTAEGYPNWIPGNPPGLSETIIGKWLKARGSRSSVHLFTKVNSDKKPGGLSAKAITEGFEASLKRLQTDYIDLYFSHWPDESTEHEETLTAYDALVRSGKVRVLGASNYTADMLEAAHHTSVTKSLPRYEVVQNQYNLYDRAGFEDLLPTIEKLELGAVTYFSLASGFLSGKYRSEADFGKSQRGHGMSNYLNDKGQRILKALDEVSAANDATPAEVALAWLVAQPGVSAPIASATTVDQVKSLAKGVRLQLNEADLKVLTEAGK